MNKDDLLFLLGKMPTKAELAFKVIEEVDCGKFILKKINYSAEAGEIIPAFLLFFHIHNWQCLAIMYFRRGNPDYNRRLLSSI